MIQSIIIGLIAVVLVSCAFPVSTERAASLSSESLCSLYADEFTSESGRANIKAELNNRHAIPEDEWALIDQKKIRIGMSELGLLCSWGNAKINRSVGSWGVHKQWVYYGGCRTCTPQYVYTENGKITSWSD